MKRILIIAAVVCLFLSLGTIAASAEDSQDETVKEVAVVSQTAELTVDNEAPSSTDGVTADQQTAELAVDKEASPDTVEKEEASTITLTVKGEGEETSIHVDVMLVLDSSGSMSGAIGDAKTAAKGFVDGMNLNPDQVGVVDFDSNADLVQPLTTDGDAAKAKIDSLVAGGGTDIEDGVNEAQKELEGPNHKPGNQPVLALLTDGKSGEAGARAAATNAKSAGTRLITIGLGSNVNEDLLKDMASGPGDYYHAPTAQDLASIYQSIAQSLRLAGTNIVVTDILSPYATLVPESFTVTPDSIDGKTLTWNLGTMEIGDSWTVSYKIKMSQSGLANDYPDSKVAYTDSKSNPASKPFPEVWIDVIEEEEVVATSVEEEVPPTSVEEEVPPTSVEDGEQEALPYTGGNSPACLIFGTSLLAAGLMLCKHTWLTR